ncbi:MAG: hypothetical protein K5669_04015 [Lachnospiraceae bacterium]|nr:hypothetical protein [Lachnospiraceae bacterium]
MKNKLFKKVVTFALCGVMMLGLAACNKDGNGGAINNGNGNGNGGNNAVADSGLAKQGVFSNTDVDIDFSSSNGNYSDLVALTVSGDKGYAVVSEYSDTDGNSYHIYQIAMDGSVVSKSDFQLPEISNVPVEERDDTYYENVYLDNIKATSNLIVGGCSSSYNYTKINPETSEEEYVYEESYYICGWNLDGTLLWSTDLKSQLNYTYGYVNALCVSDSGIVLIMYYNDETQDHNILASVNPADGTFTVNKELGTSNSVYGIIAGKNGNYYGLYSDEEYNTRIGNYDVSTGELGDEIVVPSTVYSMGTGNLIAGTDTDFMIASSSGIYKFNIGDSDLKLVMDSVNSDLDGNGIDKYGFFDDTHFIAAYSTISDYTTKVSVFTYVDPSTIPDKTVLTLAAYYLGGDLRKHVVDFNKESAEYRITVKDYSQYSELDAWDAGYTRLNNDILAGNMPDMMFINPEPGIDFRNYAKKNLLVDLSELMAKDPEISANKYLTNVFDAFAINGKYYQCVPMFNYNTFMGNKSIIGDKKSLTVDDFINLMQANPGSQFSEYSSRSTFLNYVLNFDGSEFINLDTGKCAFDSEDFVKLLEYAGSLPEEPEYGDYYEDYYDQYRSGKTLFTPLYLYDMNSFQYQRYSFFNGNAVLCGFPTTMEQPGLINYGTTPFVITNGKNVDGAWEFCRYFLTAEYQNNIDYAFPILETAFDAYVAKAMEKPSWEDENGIIQYYDQTYYVDGVEETIPTMTQAEVDEIKTIIKGCTKSGYTNQAIMSIIEEEASAYFAGSKSVQDVCGVIQSRVQLYINENS